MRARCLVTVLGIALTMGLVPERAEACGGFFCNATTLSPIFQAGERVVFARHEDEVTMHVEIVYEGEPTDFGWLLPLPKVPTDTAGEMRPLEDVLRTSTAELFDRLQAATNPIFRIDNTFDNDHCGDEANIALSAAGRSVDGGASAGPGADSGVRVLQEANIGPFGATLVAATDANELFTWLSEENYVQDENARPMIKSYVDSEYVFLGLKLLSGKKTGDLRPVELSLGDTHACIPLRLTAIAATANMPILVWVLGEHRAIPKNFLHTLVNPRALVWPDGQNYVDLVTRAVNNVRGRAYVTEYANDEPVFADQLYSSMRRNLRDELKLAETLADVIAVALGASDSVPATNPNMGFGPAPGGLSVGMASDGGAALFSEIDSVIRAHITKPEGLKGFPYGNCNYSPYYEEEPEWCEEKSADHETTDDDFYGYLDYWVDELKRRETPLEGDIEAIRSALEDDFFAPRERIQTMFDDAAWITRFFTTMDDKEMTRDPVFSFNPDLGRVENERVLTTVIKAAADCKSEHVEATFPDGTFATFPCEGGCRGTPTLGPIEGEEALLRVEVLDEQGEAQPFDRAQAGAVDTLMDSAAVGSPTIPESFTLKAPPERVIVAPRGGTADIVSPDKHVGVGGGGCAGSSLPAGSPFAFLGLALLGAGLLLRRTRREA